ncbi:LacI family DNA-binding transcriptional regulator [Humibacter soli]
MASTGRTLTGARESGRTSSITDIAGAAGVSTATVSRALRGLPNVSETTRDRVRRAADDLGYVPSSSASGLASGRTMAMGAIVPGLALPFCAEVIEGVDAVLRSESYDLILFSLGQHGGERERVFRRTILRRRTDALIALCIDFDAEERRQLVATGNPVMLVGGSVRGLPHVAIDQADAARMATRHLIESGHTCIAHLGGAGLPGRTKATASQRREGYESALRDAGIPVRPELAIRADPDPAMTRRRLAALLTAREPRPTAFFADSDSLGVMAILVAEGVGLRVPSELSVAGIDDHGLAEVFGLTAVAQDPFDQGATAARMLLDQLAGRRTRLRSARHPVRLIERGSTAPAPAG